MIEKLTFSSKEEQFQYYGDMFGYPQCCIDFFINSDRYPYWFDDLPWYNTSNFKLYGYVPCEKCATKSRQSLIDEINCNRKVDKLV